MEENQDADGLQTDWLREEWKKFEDGVREKPHQSILIAFCAGLLAGALLRKRS